MKTFFATTVAIILVLLFPLLLLGTVLRFHVLTADFTKALVHESRISASVPDLIINKMIESQKEEQGQGSENLNNDGQQASGPSDEEIAQMREQIARVFTQERVDMLLDNTIDTAFFAYWENGAPIEEYGFTIDVSEYKEDLAPLYKTMDEGENGEMQEVPNEIVVSLKPLAEADPEKFVEINETIQQVRMIDLWVQRGIWIGWALWVLLLAGLVVLKWNSHTVLTLWLTAVGTALSVEALLLALAAWYAPSFLSSLLDAASMEPAILSAVTLGIQHMSTQLWCLFAWVLLGLCLVTAVSIGAHQYMRKQKNR